MAKNDTWTLGTAVIPAHYEIRITPNLSNFVFHGEETIQISVSKSTDRITLNSKELKIGSASVTVKGTTYKAKISENKVKEELTLILPCKVRGDAALHITFSGHNGDALCGFYRSSYKHKGKKGYILTTHFESSDARMAFPCFDEPALKATYSISLMIDRNLDAISNMPIKKEVNIGDGKKLVTFLRTPRMSSYLVYFCVGHFERMTKRAGKIKVGVATAPGRIKQARMALGFAVKFIEFYQNYFRIKYPLPKIDLIAVPDSYTAMENWGAISFREDLMLCDKKSAMRTKQNVARTVAHELAHQWFGDLVTMKWWDDTWLNESFAELMEYEAPDSVFPGWKMLDQYFIISISAALSADQLISTHPINVHVRKPAEIEEIFDSISYFKGSSVLYMLENYVGQDVFRRSLHNYFSKHAYSNTTKSDLWSEIDAEARKHGIRDVELIARRWIEEPGYPLIEVSRSGSSLKLVQRRTTLSKAINKQVWPIPLSYRMQDGSAGKKLMLGRTASIELGSNSWIKLNSSQTGFYRVSYPDDILEKLGEAIRSRILPDRDSWGIVGDLFFLARSGRVPARKYLDFVIRYCMVDAQLTNLSVLSHLHWFRMMLGGTKMQAEVDKAAESYGSALLKRLTWRSKQSDNNLTKMIRSGSVSLLGTVRDKGVLKASRTMFDAFLKKGKLVDPDLRAAVYANVVRSDPSTYDIMKKLYAKEESPQDKQTFLAAMGTASDPMHLRDVLAFSSSEAVRLMDARIIFYAESGHPETHATLLKWVEHNWKSVLKIYLLIMHSDFIAIFDSVEDKHVYLDLKTFFSKKENMRDEIKRTLAQTLEKIRANIAFFEKNSS